MHFNFEVTPLGRIYRIQSSQQLGQFALDDAFRSTLANKLSAKYGVPARTTASVYEWELIEQVRTPEGEANPFRTMWMTAMVMDNGGAKSLEMTLLDFRVLWTDEDKVNKPGRAAAESKVKF